MLSRDSSGCARNENVVARNLLGRNPCANHAAGIRCVPKDSTTLGGQQRLAPARCNGIGAVAPPQFWIPAIPADGPAGYAWEPVMLVGYSTGHSLACCVACLLACYSVGVTAQTTSIWRLSKRRPPRSRNTRRWSGCVFSTANSGPWPPRHYNERAHGGRVERQGRRLILTHDAMVCMTQLSGRR